jgi:hypothetical protein
MPPRAVPRPSGRPETFASEDILDILAEYFIEPEMTTWDAALFNLPDRKRSEVTCTRDITRN